METLLKTILTIKTTNNNKTKLGQGQIS